MNVEQIAAAAKQHDSAHKRACRVRGVGIHCSYHERLRKIKAAAEFLIENEIFIRAALLGERTTEAGAA